MFRNARILSCSALIAICVAGPECKAAPILPGGKFDDERTSIAYSPLSGEVSIDAPPSTGLTSIRIVSASSVFTGDPAEHLVLPPAGFDIDEDDVIFKATFGSSFSSLSLGTVARTGLAQSFLLGDLDVTGSVAGGGDLGPVDLIVVPEPSAAVLAFVGLVAFRLVSVRSHRRSGSAIGDRIVGPKRRIG